MKKIVKVMICILTVMMTMGCQPVKPDNIPYEPNTPAPDPHTGVFKSEYGSMTFNGDGETVVCDFSSEFAKLSGLPRGLSEGKYVFLSGDLPPNGSVAVRYDVAHELEITVNDISVVLDLGIAARDGSSAQSGVDTVSENRIPVLFRIDGKMMTVSFEKEKNTGG